MLLFLPWLEGAAYHIGFKKAVSSAIDCILVDGCGIDAGKAGIEQSGECQDGEEQENQDAHQNPGLIDCTQDDEGNEYNKDSQIHQSEYGIHAHVSNNLLAPGLLQ